MQRCTPEWAEPRNITCATKQDFTELGDLYLSYFVYQNLLDPADYSNPVDGIMSYTFQGLDISNVFPQYKFYYSFSNLTTDHGYFFEDNKNYEYLTYDDFQIDTNHIPSPKTFLELSFYMTNKNQIHIRSYIKIPDIIAQVGGILSLFLPFIEVFLKIFTDNEYTLYLFNCLFKMQINEPKDNIDNKFITYKKDYYSNNKGINEKIELKDIHLNNKDIDRGSLNNSKNSMLPLSVTDDNYKINHNNSNNKIQ